MPSTEHEIIADMMSGGLGMLDLTIEEQRLMMEGAAEMFPLPADVRTKKIIADHVAAEWVSVDSIHTDRVMLYLHGGAYVAGSANTHRALAGRIARATKANVLLPDYRLAPEQPFPAALEDALSCWHWLTGKGHKPENMIIAGDSAGGGLTMATLLALKANAHPLPACAIGISPWLDLTGSGESAVPGVVDDPMLTLEGLRDSARQYAADNTADPLASPIYGDLTGLPPILLQVGTRDILWSDSTRFSGSASAAGVEVTLEVEEGLIHVWHMFPDVPEAQNAVGSIGAFVNRYVSG